jgi:1,2-diacylglycerol-3-alpha-glucose alpha-1,2-glucosyltransferase
MHSNGVTTRTVVIPNGVDNERFAFNQEARQRFRTAHQCTDACVIFSVGLLIPRKGVYDFIKVANMLADNPSFCFFWVGSIEPGLKRVDISNAPSNVRFLGHVPFENMNEIYSGGDILLFPTFAESYGNVLFEAAAAERALVIRDIEIYEDWLHHNNNCLKGYCVDEFAAHIRTAAFDQALCGNLQKNAKELARKHDINITVNMLASLYESLIV